MNAQNLSMTINLNPDDKDITTTDISTVAHCVIPIQYGILTTVISVLNKRLMQINDNYECEDLIVYTAHQIKLESDS